MCVHESGWASWRRKIGKTAAGKRRCCCTDVNVYVMYNLSHIKTERTYKPGNEDSSESSKIAAQDCDRWAPENFHPGVLGDHAEVLTMSEPTDVDSIRDLAALNFARTSGSLAKLFIFWMHLLGSASLAKRAWLSTILRHLASCSTITSPCRKELTSAASQLHLGFFVPGVTTLQMQHFDPHSTKLPPHAETTKPVQALVTGNNSEERALNESVPSAAPWMRLMLPQSAEPAGVLASRWRSPWRVQQVESSHGRASWRFALRGGRRSWSRWSCMAGDLGGRTFLEQEGQTRQWLDLFRSNCGFVVTQNTCDVLGRGPLVCKLDALGRNAPLWLRPLGSQD